MCTPKSSSRKYRRGPTQPTDNEKQKYDTASGAGFVPTLSEMGLTHGELPAPPSEKGTHREKYPPHVFTIYAGVARQLDRKEMISNAKARMALQKE